MTTEQVKEQTWFDEMMESDEPFDVDVAYERIHQNHIERGLDPKWVENTDADVHLKYIYCLAEGEFEHRASLCGYRVPRQAERDNPRLRALLTKIATASTYDPGETDLDDEQPITAHITLGDVRLARGLIR